MARSLIAICAAGVALVVGCGTVLSVEDAPPSDPDDVEAGTEDPDARAVEASSDGEGLVEAGPDVTTEPACLGPAESCTKGDSCCPQVVPYVCKNGNCLACTPLGASCESEAECCDPRADCGGATCCLRATETCKESAECCSDICQMGMCK